MSAHALSFQQDGENTVDTTPAQANVMLSFGISGSETTRNSLMLNISFNEIKKSSQVAVIEENDSLREMLKTHEKESTRNIEILSQQNDILSKTIKEAERHADIQYRKYERFRNIFETRDMKSTRTIMSLQENIKTLMSQRDALESHTTRLFKMEMLLKLQNCQGGSCGNKGVSMLPCGHIFCATCISSLSWKRGQDTDESWMFCAMCGADGQSVETPISALQHFYSD